MKLTSLAHAQYDYSDDTLLKVYLEKNDINALGELYARHSEMVYYVCLRYFKESEKSKDAVMQIFQLLLDKIANQQIKDFPKWLYVVAKNFCLMALRSQKGKIEIITDDFVEFSANLHQDDSYLQKEEKLSQLELCISQLPEKQRITIDLFFINEKCYKEVVEITGYTMNEVKSFIQNGKRNLKNCMLKKDE